MRRPGSLRAALGCGSPLRDHSRCAVKQRLVRLWAGAGGWSRADGWNTPSFEASLAQVHLRGEHIALLGAASSLK